MGTPTGSAVPLPRAARLTRSSRRAASAVRSTTGASMRCEAWTCWWLPVSRSPSRARAAAGRARCCTSSARSTGPRPATSSSTAAPSTPWATSRDSGPAAVGLRLPVVQPAAHAHRAARTSRSRCSRGAPSAALRLRARGNAARARRPGRPRGTSIPAQSVRAASGSAWPSPGAWPTSRGCSWPTSRRATSTAPTRSAIIDLLDALRRERNMTLLVVTHSPEIAARAGRTVRLLDGRHVCIGHRPHAGDSRFSRRRPRRAPRRSASCCRPWSSPRWPSTTSARTAGRTTGGRPTAFLTLRVTRPTAGRSASSATTSG